MQYISQNHIIHILLSIAKLLTWNTGEKIVHAEREREKENPCNFILVLVFLASNIVGSVFAKYNLEC